MRINASTYTNGTVVKTTLRFGETTASRFIAGAIALLKPVTGVVAAYAGKISAPATITLVNGLTTRAGLATATSLAKGVTGQSAGTWAVHLNGVKATG